MHWSFQTGLDWLFSPDSKWLISPDANNGEGGAFTQYRRDCGPRSYTGGEVITPLTEEEAREWAEKYLNYDKYVSAFGEPEE